VSCPSKYGNPFRPIPFGDPAAHEEAVGQYLKWIAAPEQATLMADAHRELRGLDLGCGCPLGLPCHADVLLILVN
jgi:hypothetical protein